MLRSIGTVEAFRAHSVSIVDHRTESGIAVVTLRASLTGRLHRLILERVKILVFLYVHIIVTQLLVIQQYKVKQNFNQIK